MRVLKENEIKWTMQRDVLCRAINQYIRWRTARARAMKAIQEIVPGAQLDESGFEALVLQLQKTEPGGIVRHIKTIFGGEGAP